MLQISKQGRYSLDIKIFEVFSTEMRFWIYSLPPFLVAQRSNKQVALLALSMHEGTQNIKTCCPVDAYFLGITGWGSGMVWARPVLATLPHSEKWVLTPSPEQWLFTIRGRKISDGLCLFHGTTLSPLPLQFQIWKNLSVTLHQVPFQELRSGLSNLFTDMIQRKHDHPHRVKAHYQKLGYLGFPLLIIILQI